MKLVPVKKKKMTKRYQLRNIQTLLNQGFTQQELRDLCFYELDFRPVYDQLPPVAGKTEIVRNLLEYAEQKMLLDTLLDLARKHNPARYSQHQPYFLLISKRSPKD